jgi:hypothetical protein
MIQDDRVQHVALSMVQQIHRKTLLPLACTATRSLTITGVMLDSVTQVNNHTASNPLNYI